MRGMSFQLMLLIYYLQCFKSYCLLIILLFVCSFEGEMSEKDKSSITMHDVDAGALQLLVDFAYTGEILISEDNVQVRKFAI